MKQLFGAGYTLRDRYAIQTSTKKQANEHTYLVEDEAQNDEICVLRQFIPTSQEIAQKLNLLLPEVRQLFSASHPHICQIKDAFWDGESFCIVESRVEGKTYQETITSRILTESELERWLVQILGALSYLHGLGIYHRNISPATIVCRLSDSAPVLTEFGVLQDLRTCLGTPEGTPSLLTDLNLVGAGEIPPNASGDLYALAVTAILLATGKSVNGLYDPQTRTWEWGKYKLFSDRLTEVLNRMLAPQLSDRFFSADDALQVLNPTISSTTTHYPTILPALSTIQVDAPTQFDSPPDKSLDWSPIAQPEQVKGWKVALGTGILVALSGVAGFVVFNRTSQPPSQQSSQPPSQSIGQSEALPTSQPSPLPTATVTITPTPTPTPLNVPASEEFSAANAQALTQRYLNAKSSIFAPPFDRQLAAELTTGKLRREIDEAINWVQANNGYYRYGFRSVGATGRIYYNSNTNAIADLRIIEQYNYYQNGKEDLSQRDYYDKIIRWSFEKENGVWKISDREVTRK